jgi:hypothetical protein
VLPLVVQLQAAALFAVAVLPLPETRVTSVVILLVPKMALRRSKM